MLEAGAVAHKNTVNIMVKNVVDVVFGGMTYWMFGYAFSFGDGPYSNPFCGLGDDACGHNEDLTMTSTTLMIMVIFMIKVSEMCHHCRFFQGEVAC